MKYIIENEELTIEVDSLGAELQLLQSKRDGYNYLWSGDPDVWSGRAPILFPFVGVLHDDTYRFQNQTYRMQKHGFARRSEFALTQRSDTAITFSLCDSKETIRDFPFRFRLDIQFVLEGTRLTVTHTVKNTGDEDMWFSLGAHPAFACALGDKLRFEEKETIDALRIDNDALSEEKEPFLQDEDTWSIAADSFLRDAFVLEGLSSRSLTLARQNGRKLKFDFNTPYLGIWAKIGASFVCLEPWFGVDDTISHDGELTTKKGIERLKGGSSLSLSYSIEIMMKTKHEPEKKFIQNQRVLKGKVGRRGNMSQNGCGIVALYNAENILNDLDFSWKSIQKEVNRHPLFSTVLGGTLGITPWAIKRYFRKRGYFTCWRPLKYASRQADAYILWTIWRNPLGKHKIGAHYQAAYWGVDDKLMVTNYPSKHVDFEAFKRSDKGIRFARVLEIYKKNT